MADIQQVLRRIRYAANRQFELERAAEQEKTDPIPYRHAKNELYVIATKLEEEFKV